MNRHVVNDHLGQLLLLAFVHFIRLLALAALAVALVAPGPARAHGTLHEQIADLDRRIAEDPDDGKLFLERGDLHRRHRDWAKAFADLDRAAALDARNIEVRYSRAKTYLDSGQPAKAASELEGYLALLSDEPELDDRRASALLRLGKAVRRLGRPLEAAHCYRRAVDLADRPGPQAFLDCARAFDAAGKAHLEAALRCLDDGLERLGGVVSLERQAIELELRHSRFDDALERLDRLADLSPRKETWWVERGEILETAERRAEAREVFLEARAAIAELPDGRRRSRAVLNLEQRIAAGLARLGCVFPPRSPQGEALEKKEPTQQNVQNPQPRRSGR